MVRKSSLFSFSIPKRMAEVQPSPVPSDIISYTKLLLKLFGSDICVSPSVFSRYVAKPIIRLLILAAVVIYMTLGFHSSDRFVVDSSILLFLVALLIFHFVGIRHKTHVRNMVDLTIEVLTHEEQKEIKRYDKRQFILVIISFIIQLSIAAFYPIYYGGREFYFLLLGQSAPSVIASQVLGVSFYLIACNFSAVILYYTMVVKLMVVYGKHCNRIFKLLRTIATPKRILCAKRFFEFHSEYMECINETLGVIPLFFLLILFSYTVAGFSFIMTFESNFSPLFLITHVGLIAVQAFIIATDMIETCTDATEIMTRAKFEMIQVLSDPDDLSNFEMREAKRGLSVFISNYDVTPVLAWKMFTVKRSLIPSFFDSVIPFTVMILTTQIKRN